jgi:hypothetical protein
MRQALRQLLRAAIVASAVLIAVPAPAHHSGAMFDSTKTLKFEGTVKEFQWTNPHSWLQLLVPDGKGGQEEWSLELGPLVGLHRAGWKPRTLQPGDKVSVVINPLRDGTHGGKLVTVTLPGGQVLNGQGGSADAAEARHSS